MKKNVLSFELVNGFVVVDVLILSLTISVALIVIINCVLPFRESN